MSDIITKPAGILVTVHRSKTDRGARSQFVGAARGDNRVNRPDPATFAFAGGRAGSPHVKNFGDNRFWIMSAVMVGPPLGLLGWRAP